MNQQRVLSFDDPRLQLRTNPASLSDSLTRSAMRVLDDLLASQQEALLSAPAIGLPVRLISVKSGDRLNHMLNPRLVEADNLRINRGEMNPVTGRIRRNVWRAFRVTLEGTDLSGQPKSVELSDAMAVSAQQAFELLDDPHAFAWITPFHRSWARATDPVAVARFKDIQAGLFAAPEAGTEAANTVPLACTGLREVELRQDDATPLCRIDILNPLQPLRGLDQCLLACLLALGGMGNVLMMTAAHTPVVVSALAMITQLRVHHAAQGWPLHALGLLGLDPALKAAPTDDQGIPLDHGLRHDAIVLGHDSPLLAGEDATAILRKLSKQLGGSGSVLLVPAPRRDPSLEDRLAAVFPALHLVTSPDGVVYLASKARQEIAKGHARLIALANATGQSGLPGAFADVIDLVRHRVDGARP